MAKLSLIQRETKREELVAKFAKKRAELKAVIAETFNVGTGTGTAQLQRNTAARSYHVDATHSAASSTCSDLRMAHEPSREADISSVTQA